MCQAALNEEENANSEETKTDPLSNLINILKSAVKENMKTTKNSFETLTNTHDEAKILIDGMAEKYRKLQVLKILRLTN